MSERVRGAVDPLGLAQPAPAAGPPIRTGQDRALPGAREVDLDQVVPDPDQPRKVFDAARLDDLCGSIMEYGLLQPLLVRELDLDEHGDMRYRVVAGGRRLAALRLAQERCADPGARARLRRVAVVLARSADARDRVLQLLENLQRAELEPLEEAHAYQEIIDLDRMSPPALALRLHVSAQTVRNRLRLLQDDVIADGVRRGALTLTAAQEAQKLADDGVAEVYRRLRAGESVPVARVREIRAELSSAGVGNPRRKGSGGPSAPPPPSAGDDAGVPEPERSPTETPEKQNDFVADTIQSTVVVAQAESGEGMPWLAARPARAARPPFLRLQEIDAALRNLSLDQASDEEEALTWLEVLRGIAARATRLCTALERLAGQNVTSLPPAGADWQDASPGRP